MCYDWGNWNYPVGSYNTIIKRESECFDWGGGTSKLIKIGSMRYR